MGDVSEQQEKWNGAIPAAKERVETGRMLANGRFFCGEMLAFMNGTQTGSNSEAPG